MSSGSIWQEVECGGYAGDLGAWEELALVAGGPILELGSGTGRVALHLARRGHEVWGVDADPDLVAGLSHAAESGRLDVRAVCGDARDLSLDREFALVIAPMQLLQILGGPDGRAAALAGSAAHLRGGGLLAAAIVEDAPSHLPSPGPQVPDVREADGWVYASRTLGAAVVEDRIEVRRLRQAVSPDGELTEDGHTDTLDVLCAATLEAEAAAAGLCPAKRVEVPPVDGNAGSTVVVLERA